MTDLHESFRNLLEGEPLNPPDPQAALAGGRRALARRRRRQTFAAVALAASTALAATLLRAALPVTTVPPVDGMTPALVVFERYRTLATVRSDGTQLADVGGGVSGLNPVWSPDGSRIAFVRDDAQGRGDIWVMRADGSDERLLVDCTDPCRYAEDPAYSPDGRQLAYWTDGPEGIGQVIRIVDAATGSVRLTVPAPLLQGPVQARWSPDGSTIAVSVEQYEESTGAYRRTGSAVGVIDLSADQPEIRVITAFTGNASYPTWSNDGRTILFLGGETGGPDTGGAWVADLWSVAPDGGGLRQLTRRAAGDPRLTMLDLPRGSDQLIVVLDDGGGGALARMSMDGSVTTPIVDPATGAAISGTSPDGGGG